MILLWLRNSLRKIRGILKAAYRRRIGLQIHSALIEQLESLYRINDYMNAVLTYSEALKMIAIIQPVQGLAAIANRAF